MDKKSRLTYAIIEAAVDKGIRDIEENSTRGIRNLLDLGQHFATGRFQKDFYEFAQQMLRNSDSPYYDLVNSVVKNVDHRSLKRFGINLGYNSWTYGAKKIREYEKEYGNNIPWEIVFDLRNKAGDILSPSEIAGILDEGETMGIYSSMIFVQNDDEYLNELVEMLSLRRDGAYFLFMRPEMVTDKLCKAVRNAANIFVGIRMDDENDAACKGAALKLLYRKCLYGTYRVYDDSSVEYITGGDFASAVSDLKCAFSFVVRRDGAVLKDEEVFSRFIEDSRIQSRYPFFLFDFYNDIAKVDRTISVEDCFMCIKSDGNIAARAMDYIYEGLNIRKESLKNILNLAMPRTRYV